MRTAFHEQLDALTRSIGDMCGLAGTAIQQATEALLEADIVSAEMVITNQELAFQAAEAESDAFTLLALQAPVATDLRAVVSSLRNVADVDRMRRPGTACRENRPPPTSHTRHPRRRQRLLS